MDRSKTFESVSHNILSNNLPSMDLDDWVSIAGSGHTFLLEYSLLLASFQPNLQIVDKGDPQGSMWGPCCLFYTERLPVQNCIYVFKTISIFMLMTSSSMPWGKKRLFSRFLVSVWQTDPNARSVYRPSPELSTATHSRHQQTSDSETEAVD